MRTFEHRLLEPAEHLLASLAEGRDVEARTQLLEAVAARLGGFDLEAYHAIAGISPRAPMNRLMDGAERLVDAIEALPMPPTLALSALAREQLDVSSQRTSGAYHTDFRLAQSLAGRLARGATPECRAVDPACGAGMLLAALTMAVCGHDRVSVAEFLRHGVHAADLTDAALRGTLLTLASLTSDLDAVSAMRRRWRAQDSLLADPRATCLTPSSFDLVIGNPPWEKVKATRHEHLLSEGVRRHYGSKIGAELDRSGFEAARAAAQGTAAELMRRYPSLGGGEVDLYVAFADLALDLLAPRGTAGLILPGGVIRSQGTEALRRRLANESRDVRIALHDNRAQHFGIDTRFKFVSLVMRKPASNRSARTVRLSHAHVDGSEVRLSPSVEMSHRALAMRRPDLTVPEVRNTAEWSLFCRMMDAGVDWAASGSPWEPSFCREVDMTRDRPAFQPAWLGTNAGLPLVEGRMVQAHRLGAKAYVSGEGRAARWDSLTPGTSRIAPQFRISRDRLSPAAAARVGKIRVGFCDITGQTNERAMMAVRIPAGLACGNKVPTILFPNDPGEARQLLFVAMVNSFAFDWAVRRVMTTTINYFVLTSLRLPPIEPDSLPGRRIVEIALTLAGLDAQGSGNREVLWRIAELRAEIEALVAIAWGLSLEDMRLVLGDFPLLDRGQPCLAGEGRSTITRDLIIARLVDRRHQEASSGARVDAARARDAMPFLTSETARTMCSDQGARYGRQ